MALLFSSLQQFVTPNVLFFSIGLRHHRQSRDILGKPIQERNVFYTYTEILPLSFLQHLVCQ